MKKVIFILFVFFVNSQVFAQDTLKTMFYNLYRYPDRPPANRELILKNIFNDYLPDLFMVCELVTEAGADAILEHTFNHTANLYQRAAFVPATADTADPLQQMVFYNTEKLLLVAQQTYPTLVRDINRYSFLVHHQDGDNDSIKLEVFVAHLKSSDGAANRQARLHMVDTFVKALYDVPPESHVLFAGDFNFYSALNEPGYQKILDTLNPIIMVDPIDAYGRWNDNELYKDIHTQATRTSAAGFGIGGATGGMDDRFDFIMMSKNLHTSDDFTYIPNTYRAMGNNGNCFNMRIDDTACTGAYSLNLRQHLHNMSDHTPVTMNFLARKQNTIGLNKNTLQKAEMSLPAGNLVNQKLMISINPTKKNSNIALYNAAGRLVFAKHIVANGQQQLIAVDMENYAAGIYLLKFEGKYIERYKIRKQ